VEVGEREAAVDLRLTVDYEVSIARVAEAVRQNVIARVQGMTGLVVREVDIAVDDQFFRDAAPPPPPPRRVQSGCRRGGGWRSKRRPEAAAAPAAVRCPAPRVS